MFAERERRIRRERHVLFPLFPMGFAEGFRQEIEGLETIATTAESVTNEEDRQLFFFLSDRTTIEMDIIALTQFYIIPLHFHA